MRDSSTDVSASIATLIERIARLGTFERLARGRQLLLDADALLQELFELRPQHFERGIPVRELARQLFATCRQLLELTAQRDRDPP